VRFVSLALGLIIFVAAAHAATPDPARVEPLIGDWDRFAEIEAFGPAVLPVLAELYAQAPVEERADIARVFYRLGWQSPEAKRVLMRDVHTPDESLRLSVQWALGRVSRDDEVVETLLQNMRDDGNALFRDKAACALAYDQIHLDPEQRLHLLEGLVDSLEHPKLQVRKISLKALKIHTGQSKGFDPSGSPERRAAAVHRWRRWLDEARANL
jgi:hypothetical protein